GSHLNRQNRNVLKLMVKEHSALKASAQYYGMKLKEKLGTSGKERPISLRKSSTPRTPQMSKGFKERGVDQVSGTNPVTSKISDDLQPAAKDSRGGADELGFLHPIVKGISPSKVLRAQPWTLRSVNKLQQLQQSVARRISSIDLGWLDRCQERIQPYAELPGRSSSLATGQSGATCELNSDCRKLSPEGNPLSFNDSTLQANDKPLVFNDTTQVASEKPLHQGDAFPTVNKRPCSLSRTSTSADDMLSLCGDVSLKAEYNEPLVSTSYVANPENPAESEDDCFQDVHTCQKKRSTGKVQNVTKHRLECQLNTNSLTTEERSSYVQDSSPETSNKAEFNGITADCEQFIEVLNPGKGSQDIQISSKKRRRKSTAGVESAEACEDLQGNAKKRRKATKSSGTTSAPKQKKKQTIKAVGDESSLAVNGDKRKPNPEMPRENLYGDVEEDSFSSGAQKSRHNTGFKAESEEKMETSEVIDNDIAPLPTLEEVARLTSMCDTARIPGDTREPLEPMPATEVLLNTVRPTFEQPAAPPPMEPLYRLGEDGKVIATPAEVHEALSELGYRSFRPGQELTVMRILSGLSTLVVLSTGMGKSFCYQLPAYLYAKRSKCITLVISPLVSLMDDQVSGLPSNLKAVCIHSSMTRAQREAAIAKVLKERLGVKCLLGLTATATLSTAQNIAHHLEIQEAEGIAVRSADIPANLFLSVSTDRDRDQGLVTLIQGDRFASLDSIIVYCTRREETARIAALLRTCLQGVTLKELPPELSKEEDTAEEILAKRKKAMARKKVRRPLKWIADCYHAGMSASQRRRIQNNFMSGQLRIVVATVAFGMGLDKSDVRGIVHYNMPKGFENYVQEIGRAGRDGKPAHCHLFLDPEGGDLNELRRHIYADTVDYYTVKKLVQKVFPPCKCEIHQKQQTIISCGAITDDEMMAIPDPSEELLPEEVQALKGFEGSSPRICHGHERALPIQNTIEMLDLREEGIETLLCYLELHPQHWVELMHPTFSICHLQCYSGPMQLRTIARRCPPVAVALAKERLCGVDHTHSSSVKFDVVELADSMGWELLPVRRELRQLQWTTSQSKPGFQGTGKSGVLVEFSSLSFHFRSYGDLSHEELDAVCKFLHQRVQTLEKTALCRLKACFKSFHRVSFKNCSICADAVSVEKSSCLKQLLKDYFDQKNDNSQSTSYQEQDEHDLNRVKIKDWESQIRADIGQFLSIRHDEKFSGRAVARIFHGIDSPCYPAQVYGRDRRFWRKYLHFDFNEIMQMATEEIIRIK
ncbi:hypothetical protein scyTo_0015668, partial [Scyliorhinus torazame]|nr:hypothetical protein [Scyliorhinus torazame]